MKKQLKKLFVLLAAAAFTAALSLTAAAAVDGEITSLTVTKTVTTDGNTYAPDTTFSFTVVNTNVSEEVTYTGTGATLSDGVAGGLTAGSGITFSPSTTGQPAASYSGTTSLTINASVFTSTGIYVYTVTETSGSYEGIIYDTTTYHVYLYIYYDSTSSSYYCGNVIVTTVTTDDSGTTTAETKAGSSDDEATTEADDSITFTNVYGDDGDSTTTDDDTTHDVTITNTISGNLADSTDTFTYTVTVSSSESDTTEYYKVVTTISGSSTTSYLTSGTATAFTLGADDTIVIYGLTATDQVTVVESDYDDYTVTISAMTGVTGTNSESVNDEDHDVTFTVTADSAKFGYNNDKSSTTPTGLFLNFAPYIIIVLAACVLAVLFFGRRKKED